MGKKSKKRMTDDEYQERLLELEEEKLKLLRMLVEKYTKEDKQPKQSAQDQTYETELYTLSKACEGMSLAEIIERSKQDK